MHIASKFILFDLGGHNFTCKLTMRGLCLLSSLPAGHQYCPLYDRAPRMPPHSQSASCIFSTSAGGRVKDGIWLVVNGTMAFQSFPKFRTNGLASCYCT